MCAGSALRQEYGQEYGQEYRQEYRRCLEREFRRGRAGACSDPSFGERLRQRLRLEPALLGALQEDGPGLLSRGLRGRPDPGPALRGLASAFRLLELAAVNLYLFPWRKEFGTVQTFSGAYVHLLRPALPEADLVRIFSRLGYERRDRHCLAISRPPPGPELAAAACGFFACRLECEILAEVMLRLQPRQLRAEDLLEARWLAGDADTCAEILQQRGTQREAAANCGDTVDLYQEMLAGSEDPGGEDAARAALWRDPGSPRGAQDVPGRGWDRCGDGELGQEPMPSTGTPDPDTSSSSCLFLEQELGGASSPLSALATGSISPPVPVEPQDLAPPVLQEAPELPCYQLHSCLRRGTLPSYCCTTCQQLHAGACVVGQACRTRHSGQELRSERQRRLWLQRTEVDMLLADGSGPWA
ncbi:spermatogenesis-associated protein 2-like protein [Grus americana]|uniref:spermatogenesis-associated protein 2-like protein n=1 Tax=Grus americana TaxID=9117 RepID=UPI0024086F3C|nr:spermatogenesis-associated protein 2-like protein [Grus americana]